MQARASRTPAKNPSRSRARVDEFHGRMRLGEEETTKREAGEAPRDEEARAGALEHGRQVIATAEVEHAQEDEQTHEVGQAGQVG